MRQDNLADYGLPAAAAPDGPLAAGGVVAATPVDQENYYGSPDYDYDKVSQDNVMLRAEHDFSPAVTLRNQTRYNRAERDAVITSIANPAAYDPATNLVTLSRQVNFRTNEIFSNQTNLTARLTTGRLRHDLSAGMEISSESQFAPTMAGAGTRAPIDLNRPDVFSPVLDMNVVPTGALSDGDTDTRGVLRLRRVRHRPALPRQRRRPCRELQHEVTRGRCDRHRHRRRRRWHARQRQGGPDLPAQRQRQSVRLRTARR